MKISIDFIGCYLEHKEFFDEMATAMILCGNEVGILTGERENKRVDIMKILGFKPSFVILWGQDETVMNTSVWKIDKMIENQILVHYDDEATQMKQFTNRWIIKTMNSSTPEKF